MDHITIIVAYNLEEYKGEPLKGKYYFEWQPAREY
jgi:hypothetical protein